jgi:hypothetical protein
MKRRIPRNGFPRRRGIIVGIFGFVYVFQFAFADLTLVHRIAVPLFLRRVGS